MHSLTKWLSSLFFLSLALILQGPASAQADESIPLKESDVAECIELAKSHFTAQYGTWMAERITSVESELNSEHDELDIRIHYFWGAAKFRRYFCGFEYEGRLECDPAFSAPGAL